MGWFAEDCGTFSMSCGEILLPLASEVFLARCNSFRIRSPRMPYGHFQGIVDRVAVNDIDSTAGINGHGGPAWLIATDGNQLDSPTRAVPYCVLDGPGVFIANVQQTLAIDQQRAPISTPS